MKKITITISYDEEKISALKLYLGQKDTSAEDELTKALDVLYSKSVPAVVREFIEMRSGAVNTTATAKTKKSKTPSTVSTGVHAHENTAPAFPDSGENARCISNDL